MASRGTRADHYRAIAAFYGSRLIEDLCNPNVPEFVIQADARRVAHCALAALAFAAKPSRKKALCRGLEAPAPVWLRPPDPVTPFSPEP